MDDLACKELVELVTDYLEGALDAETTVRFEEHLADCPGCAAYLDQMRETAARLAQVPVATLTGETRSTLLAAFRDFHH